MLTLLEELNKTQTTSTVTSRTSITSLYDVIAALNEHVAPEEDDVVIAAVVHMCESGCLRRFPSSKKYDFLSV